MKEAIEKVRSLNEILCEETISDIVSALECGKAYKKIVGILENIHCVGEDFKDGETSYKRRKLVKDLKQKYLPKE